MSDLLTVVEDVEVRDNDGNFSDLVCNHCDNPICDVEDGDSLGLLVRTAAAHIATGNGVVR